MMLAGQSFQPLRPIFLFWHGDAVNAEEQLDVCGSLTDEALHIAYQNYLA
jgi:hypothetical protein